MDLLQTTLNIADRPCVVVGDTAQALLLANWLIQHQAIVTVFGNAPSSQAPHARLSFTSKPVSDADIDQCWLVVAASNDKAVNSKISAMCYARKCFCYTVDDPQLSSWQINHQQPSHGRVALVGAGPGDPELLTLRALRLIRQADVIVYDRLVSEAIMSCCNPAAELIYAGKAKSDHALPQESINQLLVRLAQRPANVVRLKGGDPFIFGRGGEEIETLAENQVPFEVVPGITAGSGCAAFAGIPLTHRDYAQACVFVTGHLRDGEINLEWEHLATPYQTVVVYMSLTGLDKICAALIRHGRAPDTPAALVQQGTHPEQKVYTGTIADLPALIAKSEVSAPTLLIIGEVVQLRDKLNWFTSEASTSS